MSNPRILIVLTSHDRLGDTGRPTGAYLSELSHALAVFDRAGLDYDFVSPRGGQAPLDGVDRKDPINAGLLDNAATMARLAATPRPDQVDADKYGAVYVPGGHGTMWDLPDDAGIARLIAAVHDRGGVVAAVCHGPAALVNVRLADGRYLVADQPVSAFTDEEEAAVNLTGVVPFLLETTLRERGARVTKAPKFQPHVVVGHRLVTGQNPASATGVAEKLVEALAA